jgi:biopolymer transport protein ExbD
MRIPLRNQRGRLQMNMTPMIDVVFLLIIFFLVSSHLKKQEAHAELDLPAAETGEENSTTDLRKLTINISAEQSGFTIAFGSRIVPIEKLSAQLQNELKRARGKLEVRIRVDRAVPYRAVEPILVSCANLNIWKVNFAVIRPENTSTKFSP